MRAAASGASLIMPVRRSGVREVSEDKVRMRSDEICIRPLKASSFNFSKLSVMNLLAAGERLMLLRI